MVGDGPGVKELILGGVGKVWGERRKEGDKWLRDSYDDPCSLQGSETSTVPQL